MAESPTLGELESLASTPVPTETAHDSIREAMRQAEQPADAGTGGKDDGTSLTAKPISGEEAPPGTVKADQPRDPQTGKFKTKEAAEAAPENGSQTPPAATEQPKEGEAETDLDPIEPPHHWKLADQEAFRKLTPEAQRFVMAQVDPLAKELETTKASTGKYGWVDQVIDQGRQTAWARSGMDAPTALRQLFALSDFAGQDPAGFLRYFAQQHRLDPAQVFGITAQPVGDPNAAESLLAGDPVVAQIMEQNRRLTEQVNQLTQAWQGNAQQAEHAAVARTDAEIDAFRSATDEKGAPKHPYFDEVRPLMAALYEAGQANDLATAYQMACRASPEVSGKIEAAQKAAAAREQSRQAREKSAAAARAGTSVTGQPAARTTAQPTGDIRADLRAQFAQHGLV